MRQHQQMRLHLLSDGPQQPVQEDYGPSNELRQGDGDDRGVGALQDERAEPVVDRDQQSQRLVLTL